MEFFLKNWFTYLTTSLKFSFLSLLQSCFYLSLFVTPPHVPHPTSCPPYIPLFSINTSFILECVVGLGIRHPGNVESQVWTRPFPDPVELSRLSGSPPSDLHACSWLFHTERAHCVLMAWGAPKGLWSWAPTWKGLANTAAVVFLPWKSCELTCPFHEGEWPVVPHFPLRPGPCSSPPQSCHWPQSCRFITLAVPEVRDAVAGHSLLEPLFLGCWTSCFSFDFTHPCPNSRHVPKCLLCCHLCPQDVSSAASQLGPLSPCLRRTSQPLVPPRLQDPALILRPRWLDSLTQCSHGCFGCSITRVYSMAILHDPGRHPDWWSSAVTLSQGTGVGIADPTENSCAC